MRRLGPFNPSTGEPDTNLPWQDGNPATGQEGSIPSHRHWTHPIEEIVHVIEQAGLQPTSADLTQLWQAIQIAIEQGPGGGVGGAYVTQALALANLPFFPEVLTADGRMTLSAGTGEVVLAADQNFRHRGLFPHSTSDWDLAARTFATAPSKTYHLRWTPLGGFVLKDLADGDYNSGALNEWDVAFDSRLDDMLLHRVVTDSANVATITALANRHALEFENEASGAGQVYTSGSGNDGGRFRHEWTFNWARRPRISLSGWVAQNGGPTLHGHANLITVHSQTRYAVDAEVACDWTSALSSVDGALRITAFARQG